MPHELVTHARHEAAHLGGQVRELLAWWLGISFGGLSATLGLIFVLWPATVHLWNGVFVGMLLLGVAFCRVSDLFTDPSSGARRRRVPAWAATATALLVALIVLRGMVGVDAPLATALTLVLSLVAFTDIAAAIRRGIASRVGARAAVYLPAALATGAAAISGHLPAATVAVTALAVGIVEAATAATTGMKSLRWHAAARDAGLLTGEIRPFRESPGEQRVLADADADADADTGFDAGAPEAAVNPRPGNGPVIGGTPVSRRPAGAPSRSAGRPAGRATINRPAVGRARVTSQD